MNITKQGHKARQEKALEMWLRIATDYNGGISAINIAKRYKITREHVHWILRKLKTMTIN